MSQKVTQLLQKWGEDGDRNALDELLPLVYRELRHLAASSLRRERSDHTLQPTALVHEAYLRLIRQKEGGFQNRAQFYALAAKVMRNLLINHAESRRAAKRGGSRQAVEFSENIAVSPELNLDVVALGQALEKLERIDRQAAQIVELKFFGGLTNQETSQVVGKSLPTVEREWAFARSWLYHTITQQYEQCA